MRLPLNNTVSIGSVLDKNRGIGPGFDFMRLALASSVVVYHSFQLTIGRQMQVGWLHPVVDMIVPAFFALSGFLVAGSAIRVRNVRTFIAFRALRILPALCVEITVSALVLGPLVTNLPLRDYYQDPLFARYFLNVIGWIHYQLPGVFLNNPVPDTVNGQLWTVPQELHCYILMAILMIFGLTSRPRIMLAIWIIGTVLETASLVRHGLHLANLLQSGETLVLCFLCGNVFYLWRHHIPVRLDLFLLSIVVFAAVSLRYNDLAFLVGVICATYFISYLGMLRFPRIPVLMAGDYSYGIYLYSFALQQAVIWATPPMFRISWINLAIGWPLSVAIAMLSWHFVEKPSLRLRKWLAPKATLPRPVLQEGEAAPSPELSPILEPRLR